MLENKYTEIERNNQRLFENITKLIGKSNVFPTYKKVGPKSMYMSRMKREKERIDHENIRFLRKLQDIKSDCTYDPTSKELTFIFN